MTPIVETLLSHVSPMGANGISVLTGAKILIDGGHGRTDALLLGLADRRAGLI